MDRNKAYASELWGTFILVFIGCGVVATAVLFNWPSTIYGIAAIWGVGVTLAIFSAKEYGPAHLNPAVSIAMWLFKPYPIKDLFYYIVFQFAGALLAGLAVYALFYNSFTLFEVEHQILRGSPESAQTSKAFGEFYHNYTDAINPSLSTALAMLAEAIGTYLLVFAIFVIIHLKRINKALIPPLIGLTVAVLIIFIAPYTQAGLNPARDFGPRLIAYWGGWNDAAFPPVKYGFLTVYIIGPVLGAVLATLSFKMLNRQY